MARHVEAWMNGKRLGDLGQIIIQQVSESAPDQEIVYGVRPIRAGQNVRRNRRKALRVSLSIAIRELFDLPRRTAILQQIAGWAAGGGILELSNHPDQQLHVICKSVPALGDVRDYTSEMTIEFEADEIPYWEDKAAVSASATTGASGSATLFVPGTCRDVPVTAVFTPGSGSTVTSLSVSVTGGGKTNAIALSGFSASAPVTFGRDEHDRLQITAGTASLLRYRSAASDDDLIIPAGAVTCTWVSNVSVTPAFSAKGRWL